MKEADYGNFEYYEDEDEMARPTPNIKDIIDATGRLLDQQPAYDTIINEEVGLQQGEEPVIGRVINQKLGSDGTV